MNKEEIFNNIQRQYDADKAAKPNWPVHICGQAAMVGQKAGKLMALSVEQKYNALHDADVYTKMLEDAAIENIAASIRFIENLKR
jgi:hypothetical protein